MSRPKLRAALAALALTCALLVPTGAGAATVVNGGFETGTLDGWTEVEYSAGGEWFTYSKEEVENEEFEFFSPPEGNWAAVTEQGGADTMVLYQDVALEPGMTHKLSLYVQYFSTQPIFAAPTLSYEVAENQQMRVDVMRPTAPVDSVAAGDVLATVFANKAGDPAIWAPTPMSADLSAFAGQTVRLRIANVVTEGPFLASVDAVTIASVPPPVPAPPLPSNLITKGKLELNKKQGSGKLAVNVPGPGVLKLVDGAGKGKPKLIKAAAKNPTAAGKVWVPIKPTGKGKKKLKEKGKLAFKVKVTFTPTGGLPATQTFGGKLKLNNG